MPINEAISGLFGAIFGALIVAWFSHRERHVTAKHALRHILLKNGYEIWWNESKKEPYEVINANYVEIHACYLALRSLSFCCYKCSLDNAWVAYTGVKHYKDIPDSEPYKIFTKSAVNRDQAMERIAQFLKVLA